MRRASLLAAAATHSEAGLAAVSGEYYEGGHWLASFATYLTSRRWALGSTPSQHRNRLIYKNFSVAIC